MPSSVIRWFDYDADRRALDVLFTTGRRYVYYDVPQEAADDLRAAPSKGRYFNAHIRGAFAFEESNRA